MKILFVTEAFPNANGAGWERRAAQHIRALARIGEVTVLLPWRPDGQSDPAAPTRCRALGAQTILHRTHPPAALAATLQHTNAQGRLSRAWHALRRKSYLDARAAHAERSAYRTLLRGPYDLAFAFKIQSAIWLDSVLTGTNRPARTIVDFDDIESRMFERTIVNAPGHNRFWTWKLNNQLQWLRLMERRLAQTWSATCLCSDLDADRVEQNNGARPWIVPNGYHFFDAPLPEPTGPDFTVLFVGTFRYFQNVVGAQWFVEEIWPLVRTALGDRARLVLAGFAPPKAINDLHDSHGIHVLADAPDIKAVYQQANIVIAPLLDGSGTRIKLIEAAALGRAIVTTRLGCEGLDFIDGVHAEIADSADAFAQRVIGLANTPQRRATMIAAAYEHARSRFDQSVIETDLSKRVIDQLAATPVTSPAAAPHLHAISA